MTKTTTTKRRKTTKHDKQRQKRQPTDKKRQKTINFAAWLGPMRPANEDVMCSWPVAHNYHFGCNSGRTGRRAGPVPHPGCEMDLDEVYKADFWCNLHSFLSRSRWRRFRGQLWPNFGRKLTKTKNIYSSSSSSSRGSSRSSSSS